MSIRFHPLQISMALGVSLAAMWIATQWTAAMFLYQPALGTAWLEFASIRIYAPWKLFSWWLAFDGQAPDVFARAGALAAAGGAAQWRARVWGSRLAGEP
jgi:type IV secretion system protein VirD4